MFRESMAWLALWALWDCQDYRALQEFKEMWVLPASKDPLARRDRRVLRAPLALLVLLAQRALQGWLGRREPGALRVLQGPKDLRACLAVWERQGPSARKGLLECRGRRGLRGRPDLPAPLGRPGLRAVPALRAQLAPRARGGLRAALVPLAPSALRGVLVASAPLALLAALELMVLPDRKEPWALLDHKGLQATTASHTQPALPPFWVHGACLC